MGQTRPTYAPRIFSWACSLTLPCAKACLCKAINPLTVAPLRLTSRSIAEGMPNANQ